jgi:hypothetical protein
VYSADSPSVDPLVFELGVPVLYVIHQGHNGKVANMLKWCLLRLSTHWYFRPCLFLDDHQLIVLLQRGAWTQRM